MNCLIANNQKIPVQCSMQGGGMPEPHNYRVVQLPNKPYHNV